MPRGAGSNAGTDARRRARAPEPARHAVAPHAPRPYAEQLARGVYRAPWTKGGASVLIAIDAAGACVAEALAPAALDDAAGHLPTFYRLRDFLDAADPVVTRPTLMLADHVSAMPT